MKKLAQIIIGFSSLSAVMTVCPLKTKQSEAAMLGQQVIRELGDNVKKANEVYRVSVGETEKRDALKNAHAAAETLINTLNDIKTFGSETVRGYNPAQRRLAAITLAEMLTRENSINAEIKSKRMEIKDMTDEGYVFNSAKSGKSEELSRASKKIRELHVTRKDIRQAIADQVAILGPEWSDTIKLAVNNLIVGSSYGIAYGIDWFGDHGAKLMTEKRVHAPAGARKKMRNVTLTEKQKAAIRSWHRVRKSELLSKEISTAYQLTQAKDLLNKLNDIAEDLKDVSGKHQMVLDKVNDAADSLSRKIERSKHLWLKVV